MDRQYLFRYEATLNHPLISESVIWGPGWPRYNTSKSVSENIVDEFGLDRFDLVVQKSYGNVPISEHVTYVIGNGTVILVDTSDCWDRKCVTQFFLNANIVVNPVAYYADWMEDFSKDRIIGHLPFCIDPYFFYKPVESVEKKYDVLVVGHMGPVYPLRSRLNELAKRNGISIHVRPHPAYVDLFDDKKLLSLGINVSAIEKYKPMKNAEDWFLVKQIRAYTNDLHSARMVAFDSSVFKLPVKKFWEAMMAGTPIISDIPNEFEDEMEKVIFRIDNSMSDREITDRIQKWLDNPAELRMRSQYGQNLAMKHFTCKKLVTSMVKYYHRYKRGDRGVFFKLPFSKTCYSLNIDGTKKNHWCPK